MGMCGKADVRSSILPSAEVVNALANAEKYLWAHLKMTAGKGNVVKVREAATSLALIGAFRTSLGDRRVDVASAIASLLGAFCHLVFAERKV
jgi:separase